MWTSPLPYTKCCVSTFFSHDGSMCWTVSIDPCSFIFLPSFLSPSPSLLSPFFPLPSLLSPSPSFLSPFSPLPSPLSPFSPLPSPLPPSSLPPSPLLPLSLPPLSLLPSSLSPPYTSLRFREAIRSNTYSSIHTSCHVQLLVGGYREWYHCQLPLHHSDHHC